MCWTSCQCPHDWIRPFTKKKAGKTLSDVTKAALKALSQAWGIDYAPRLILSVPENCFWKPLKTTLKTTMLLMSSSKLDYPRFVFVWRWRACILWPWLWWLPKVWGNLKLGGKHSWGNVAFVALTPAHLRWKSWFVLQLGRFRPQMSRGCFLAHDEPLKRFSKKYV